MRKKCVITKSNDLKSSFEAINLNKNFESIYKNRQKNYKCTSKSKRQKR